MSKSLEFIHDSGKIIRFTDCDFVPQEKRDFCESDAFQSSSQTFSSSSSAFQKTQVKDNEIELEDKVDLRTIAQLRYLKKYENKRKRIYLRNLEIVTRKYEEQIEPLIKQRNKLAKEIPTFWPLAIGAFPPLSSHISLSDISPLTHISEVTCHMRPRMSDGFFIRLKLDSSYGNASLLKSYALHYSQKGSLFDKLPVDSNEDISRLKLTNPGLITFPELHKRKIVLKSTKTEDIDYDSSKETKGIQSNDDILFLKARIYKINFFSYFLSFMPLSVAELVVRDLIPNAFSYYVKSFSENKA